MDLNSKKTQNLILRNAVVSRNSQYTQCRQSTTVEPIKATIDYRTNSYIFSLMKKINLFFLFRNVPSYSAIWKEKKNSTFF